MKAKIKKKRSYVGLLYISPWIVGFGVFQFYPILSSLVCSFTDFDMMGSFNFIGLGNYISMFTEDPYFWSSLWITFVYVILAVPMKLAFALIVAILLNSKLRGMNAFRTTYYLPSILGGSVAVALMWRFLFMQNGTVNSVIGLFGGTPVGWLSDPHLALFTISLLSVWQFGSSMVLFLAGLQQIPVELYEAARVDGASPLRQFFKITLPILSPIVFFNLVMQMVNAFQEFTGAFVITNGGPMKATYLYVMKLYDEGFQFFKMGYASALSWVLFIIIVVVTTFVFKTSDKWVFYSDDKGGSK